MVERTLCKVVAGGHSEVVDCRMGQPRQQLVDPTRWWLVDPETPHSHIYKPGGRGCKTDCTTQGSSKGK